MPIDLYIFHRIQTDFLKKAGFSLYQGIFLLEYQILAIHFKFSLGDHSKI